VFGGLFIAVPLYDRFEKASVDSVVDSTGEFSLIELSFSRTYHRSRGIPFAAGAVIDTDNDGRDELFLGGGVRQIDGLFTLKEKSFVNLSDERGLVKQGGGATTGVAVGDFDENGFSDLLVARERGLSLYRNDGGIFTLENLDVDIAKNEVPLSPAFADLNRDGYIDFFFFFIVRGNVGNWYGLKESPNTVRPRLYINNGDDSFTDITASVGLRFDSGVIEAVFSDLDGDGLEDLVVLGSDGSLATWRNRGNLLFENKHHSFSLDRGDYFAMTLGDYNSDSRVDLLLTNRGTTIPNQLANLFSMYRPPRKGEWRLLKNIGSFSFHDETSKVQLDGSQLARGGVMADLNGDAAVDLAVAQNHPYWPFHLLAEFRLPGKILFQRADATFTSSSQAPSLGGKGYGVVVLAGDFNGDLKPDVAHVSLGGKSRVLLNANRSANYLKVTLPDSAHARGARITVKTLSGNDRIHHYRTGGQLCGDSSHSLFLGLAEDKAIDVIVEYRDGKIDQISGVLLNTSVVFK